MSNYTVGIDLGTTNTLCCTFDNEFEFIKFKRGNILPSVVMYKDGEITVGEAAKQRRLRYPDNVISSSKTYISDRKTWIIDDRSFSATDVATEILREVCSATKKHFDTDEQIGAVITVPAYFTNSQFDETKKAAEGAGFRVINILSEPAAAAIAYGFEENVHSVFVVDIGGGTFDICLLEINKDGNETVFSTKCTGGDQKLGGDDFDDIITKMCHTYMRTEHAIDLSSHEKSGLDAESYGQAVQKIRQKAEQAKIALSNSDKTEIEIANLCMQNGRVINFQYTITRESFEKEASLLFSRIKKTINRCIEDNGVDIKKIDRVVFVGGSANIPYIRSIVTECLGQEPYADKDLSSLVAKGAAIRAAQNSTLVSTKLTIEDILSHSLGVAVVGDKFSILLNKGTKYPTKKMDVYTTASDYQRDVLIEVYEGEIVYNVKENRKYGDFTLEGIEQARQGVPQIEVTFEINADRQLIVTARDKKTNVKKSVTIKK